MVQAVLEQAKKLHFVGIGGSGMFPIVQILHARRFFITGSDNNEGSNIDAQKAMGIPIFIGHSAENIGDAEAVIYSAAIPLDNPELVAAKAAGIPVIERSEILGYITRQFEQSIGISGTHGKTTVTAMLTQILVESGMDPTAVIGGKLPLIGGNGRAGKSDIMTFEACEYQDSFLHLSPSIALILNVDEDHLEYFKTLDNIKKSFHRFAALAPKAVIVNGDDQNSLDSVKGVSAPIITFGFGVNNDYCAENIQQKSVFHTTFDVVRKGEKLVTLSLNVPGRHNISNALAAFVAALFVGVSPQEVAASLPNFKGAGRRFEKLGTINGIDIVDDYAHHPLEIEKTLEAARTMGYRKIWAVHQPFTYSRTFLLMDDFATALALADYVVLSEIMGAREKNSYDVYAKDLADKISGALWFPEFQEISDYVMSQAQAGDLVITFGCGDVYKCAQMMLESNRT